MKKNLFFCMFLFLVQHASAQLVKNVLPPCPPDITIHVSSCADKAIINWTAPRDTFPATIEIPKGMDTSKGKLLFMGSLNTHGYYVSANKYYWTPSAVIAGTIGSSRINGHLATLTTARENDFIFNIIKNTGTAPWIGLFSTGLPGYFMWIDGSPSSYTNWAPGEPNNSGGTVFNIKEPYVRLSDLFGKWNDQKDDTLKFVTEFDKPVLVYKQVSGPKSGTSQKVGVYKISYERTNLVANTKDTCSFNVTVSCNNAGRVNELDAQVNSASLAGNIFEGLKVSAAPNPSSSYFKLELLSSDFSKGISVKLSDLEGRIVELKNNLTPNQTLEIGKNLRPGVYFAQVTQGSRHIVVKMIKQ